MVKAEILEGIRKLAHRQGFNWGLAENVDQFALEADVAQPARPDVPPVIDARILATCVASTERRLCLQPLGFQTSGLSRRRVRAAHQANWFASLNVTMQALQLVAVAQRLPESWPLFVIVDHASPSQRGYRHAYLPWPGAREGTISARAPRLDDTTIPAYREDAPSADFMSGTLRQFRSILRQNLRLLSSDSRGDAGATMWQSFRSVEQDVRNALDNTERMTDFNALIMAQWVQRRLGERRPEFVHASLLIREYYDHIGWLIDNHPRLVKAGHQAMGVVTQDGQPPALIRHFRALLERLEHAPFWGVCACDTRYPLGVNDGSLQGRCPRCDRPWKLGRRHNLQNVIEEGRIIPTVIYDNILDRIALGTEMGCLYRGAREHVFFSHLIAQVAGIGIQPEFLSSLSSDFSTPVEQRAERSARAEGAKKLVRSGRASFFYYDAFSEIRPEILEVVGGF